MLTPAGKNTRRLLIMSLTIDHNKFCLFLGKRRSVSSSETGALLLPRSQGSLCPLGCSVLTVSPHKHRDPDHLCLLYGFESKSVSL